MSDNENEVTAPLNFGSAPADAETEGFTPPAFLTGGKTNVSTDAEESAAVVDGSQADLEAEVASRLSDDVSAVGADPETVAEEAPVAVAEEVAQAAEEAQVNEDTPEVTETAEEAAVTETEGNESESDGTVDSTSTQTEESTTGLGEVGNSSDSEPQSEESVEFSPKEAEIVTPEMGVADEAEDDSIESLRARQDALNRKIAEKAQAQKAVVLDQIKNVATTYGVTIEEIVEAFGGLKNKRAGSTVKAKYRDKATGNEWSGRGKEPLWIKGKDRNQFLITE